MIKHIYDHEGVRLIETVEATPQCGDYCDSCGDCLGCDGEQKCYGNRLKHVWVKYQSEVARW